MSANASDADPIAHDAAPPVETPTLEQGLEALNNCDYEKAVDSFEEVLKGKVAVHGEIAVECALPGYYYGISLLHVVQVSQDVFAEKEETAQEEQQDDERTPSDLGLAWEALECARHNFELESPVLNHSRLTDVHVGLGDVACETSNFEAAVEEYKKALAHLDQTAETTEETPDRFGGKHRRYCEVHYKTCLAYEFLEDPKHAAECCDKAIESIRSEIRSLADAASEGSSDLQEIEKDLVERREAIEIMIRETDQVKNMLRQMLQQNTQLQKEEKDEDAVVNLGVVGRGKSRIQLGKIDEADESKETTAKTETPSATKRTSRIGTDPEETKSCKKPKLEENNEERTATTD